MVGDVTYNTLLERVNSVEKLTRSMQLQIQEIQTSLNARTRVSDLKSSENELMIHINALKTVTNSIEQRLTTIKLPEETRYYLEQSEVDSFRSNFSKLLAMMSEFQNLYTNLIAYASNNSR